MGNIITNGKKGQGHKWSLTPKRLEYIIKQLQEQNTLTAIAQHLDITVDTLKKRLKEADIEPKQVQAAGIGNLRRAMFKLIPQLEGKEQFDSGMKYLSRYEKLDDTPDDTDTSTVSIDIVAKIRNELA